MSDPGDRQARRPTNGTILGRARNTAAATDGEEELIEVADTDDTGGPASAGDAAGPDVGPRPSAIAGGDGAPRWPLVACVVLALAALVFALLALQQRSAVQRQADQANALRNVSGQTIAALTSYDYQHLDQWKTSVLANATGSFQNQFESSFAGFEQAYVAEHNRGTGAIQGVWVGPVSAGKATTVVLVQITVTSLTGTHSLDPYVQLTLLKVAGRWRVDDVEATFDTGGGGGPSPTDGASTPTSSP